MTKNLLAILLLLFCCQISFANKVDDLKTDADVLKFLIEVNKHAKEKIKDINILPSDTIAKHFECDTLAKTRNIKNWSKLDINHDGHTDLLVICNYDSYLILDKGYNHFELLPIQDYPAECPIATSVHIGQNSYIVFYSNKPKYDKSIMQMAMNKEFLNIDTLVYKFNFLIEHNPNPANYDIDSIIFSTKMCFGTCPVFKITINRFGNAVYTAGKFSNEVGIFKTTIKMIDMFKIKDILNYIGVKKLDDNYAIAATDNPTCILRIKFGDGSVKEINDYGELGTFGLRGMYNLFFSLRTSQDWFPVE